LFNSVGGLARPDVFGVLSLITWADFIVVTLKYIVVIMRADNDGEGGILALTALALRIPRPGTLLAWFVLTAGLLGAALFYGDGVITPAISVLSAVEGLRVATKIFDSFIVPITLLILFALFQLQHLGTARIGSCFGIIMAVWFSVIGLLGAIQITRHPDILLALNPVYGIELLASDPRKGFVLLGFVVLAVTGAEALYADMGQFGKRPIRLAWLSLVFPAVMLNYFGQGGLLLDAQAAPQKLNLPFEALYSTLGRIVARGIESKLMVDRMAVWHDRLMANIGAGNVKTFNDEKWEPSSWPAHARGVGTIEGPRGALGHWIIIDNGKITNYQAVVPTTWKAGPMDASAQHGPYEAALMAGHRLAIPDQPLEVLRTIHSFDPCMACAAHVFGPAREDIVTVKIR
jgi:hypothetical protein